MKTNGKKVFISADIEGVAGLTVWEEARQQDSQYIQMARQMGFEVAAACRGAEAAGAQTILVKDSHASGRNIDAYLLPKNVELIRGWYGDPYTMISGIDETFDALLFVGYHDIAGGEGNPTAHTINSSKVASIELNGQLVGEFHLEAYAAAYLGVPAVFLSGDAAICERAKDFLPGIHTVATKYGIGEGTRSIGPQLAIERIEEQVQKALEADLSTCLIELPEKFTIRVYYRYHYDAHRNSHYPGTRKISPTGIEYSNANYYEILRFLMFVI
ncbi:MAG: M55 family metallopeptidase [Tissierellia bacterium]|nr:M55 family metallopeptidase [Tissierellia bacterium]